MLNLPEKEIGDGREPDMGMGTHVGPLPGGDLRRPDMIKEYERADHLTLRRRQSAAHLEAAEIDRARHDQRFDGVDGDSVGVPGLERWVPAHC
jgi:hypothetical protein